jgi:hypothetical protein
MADGTTKPIKDVKTGDHVEATDPTTQTTNSEPVTQLHDNQDTDLTDLTLTDGNRQLSIIHTTQNHPFWDVTTQQWTPTALLRRGDALQTPTGTGAHVTSVHSFTGRKSMLNLTVADIHTYYVVAGTTPVLVHNTCEHAVVGLQDVGGNNLALDEFALDRGGSTYKEWPGSGPWHEKFTSFLGSGSKTRISVNLDGIDDPIASARAGANVDPSGWEGLTNWELHQISQSPDAWSRITWYRGGNVDANPFG